MTYSFLCHPTCTTCQKARDWLTLHEISYIERDIRHDRPSARELADWIERSGLLLHRFFNTSGQRYRELGLTLKLPAMSREEQIALLATDGMLVRRPILVAGTHVLVGFREKEWEEVLGGS